MNPSVEAVSDLVGQYLRVRRALGYKLDNAESILGRFIAYLEVHDADGVRVADAVGFATAPPARTARTQALRLSAVRCFARWAHCQDPSIEVPPARLLPARPSRVAPSSTPPSNSMRCWTQPGACSHRRGPRPTRP